MKSRNELKVKETEINSRVCYYLDDIINGTKLILVMFYYTKNYMKVFPHKTHILIRYF